ncbi:sigma-70 family RNA polymerase sigma factor [Luteolibacter arcticus]|uniref:Sigma-70 family RNA polymerase sigma factor n=1 Tax=Luteolibacter arcticus TaxID=1581411 RepID=A0ABT3GG27_9BACT|nr:sigma-70 family RNA polymerase sigma factor [Luteolibacter arcticus]MCW1922265.1 sigma-70 family RNA polymerase sigma factor [Luteolibacter arcticus]
MSCPAPELFSTPPGDDAAWIAGEIAALRPGLLGYVASLLPQARGEAEDVVQATCVVLWEKREGFQQGTDFKAWAFRTAYFQAMAVRRDLSRSKVAVFSDETLQRLAAPAEEAASGIDTRVTALRLCVSDLPSADQRLLALKYLRRESLADHARELGMPSGRLQKTLSRLRLALKHCIEKRLKYS